MADLSESYKVTEVEMKEASDILVKYERTLAALEVDAGEDNIIGLTEIGIGLEAVGDNILVLVDSYRSGYECTACLGTGQLRMKSRCNCDPDIPNEELEVKRGTRNRFDAACEICGGDYLSKRIETLVMCEKCKGKGSSLFIPENAKTLPTTGVILSKGPDVTRGGIEVNRRIIATPHSGVFLPMKGSIPIRCYRQHEPLCVMYNIDKTGRADKRDPGELASSKFVDYDTPLGPEYNAQFLC